MFIEEKTGLNLLPLNLTDSFQQLLSCFQSGGEHDSDTLAAKATAHERRTRHGLLDIFKQKREHFDQDTLDSVRSSASAEEDRRVIEAAERGIAAHALKPRVVDLQAVTD